MIGDPDDPQGGIIIPRDSIVQTQWNFDLLKVGYAWSFLNKRHYEMFIGAGLNIRSLDIEIGYEATTGTIVQRDDFDTEPKIPLPTAVLGGRWNFTEKWQGIFRQELFLLQMGDYKGSQQDFQLLFEHNTFKHIGFGFNAVHFNLRTKSNAVRKEFDSRIPGVPGYIKIYL